MGITTAARGILSTVRDLDIGAIQRSLERAPRVLVASRSSANRDFWIEGLLGPPDSLRLRQVVQVLDIEDGVLPTTSDRPDLALVMLPSAGAPRTEEVALISRLRAGGVVTILLVDQEGPAVSTSAWFPEIPRDQLIPLGDPEDVRKRLAKALCRTHPDLLTAVARYFNPTRADAVEVLIRDVAWTNSQIALLSSIPAMIPIAGALLVSVADLVILTKNQIGLVFKIAGIYGRDLNDRVGVALEIAPVVGGAFLWRTLARSLVALLPTPVGAIPKTIVAYTGTYVVGALAHYYYRHGHRPPPELIRRVRQEGLQLARRVLPWSASDR